MRRLVGRLRSLWHGRRLDADLQREINFHLAMETERHMARGLSAADARRSALLDFGSVAGHREAVRQARGISLWESLAQDVRLGVRTLARSPGYTCVAVLVLGLGIGANTAMFSVIDGVLLKPLPFQRGADLMLVQQSAPGSGLARTGVSIPELQDYRAHVHAVQDLVEYHGMSFVLLNRGEPDRVNAGVVSATFFDMLGVRPILGRTFVAADDELGAEAVLVLSHRYWQEKFGGDPNVVGTFVEMNNRPHRIVGVLPGIPQYPRENDVYMSTSACPFRAQAQTTVATNHRAFAALGVFGRLMPGASVDQAATEVKALAETLARQYPKDYENAKDLTARVVPLEDTLTSNARPMLYAIAGTTMLVLIIACANVANLSLARTVRRQRELAVRTALGAGRRRLLRMLITESVVVALAGGAFGLALAWLTQGMLTSFIARFTPRVGQIEMDYGVLAFALGVSVATGVLFGAAPALSTRRNLTPSMRDGGAGSGESAGRRRLRGALVVAQVAVAFMLLVGAGLLLRSFQRLSAVDVGFDQARVLTASVFGNFTTVQTSDDALRFNTEALEQLRHQPGIVSAAMTASVPLSNIQPGVQTVQLEGRASGDAVLQVDPNTASDGYFETLGIPILMGRSFDEHDRAGSPLVAVINQSMAAFWNGRNPVGSRFLPQGQNGPPLPPGADPWVTVIGVVRDFHLYQVDQPVEPQYYLTFRQNGGFAGRLLVRAAGNPLALVPAIKSTLFAIDPKSPVEDIQTLGELHSGKLASPGLTAALLSMFALIALAITLAGVAGVLATSVSQRAREFGLRMALGASRGSVLGLVLRQGGLLIGAGLLLGVAGALGFSRLLSGYLFGTTASDARTYAFVAALFVTAALAAMFGPARRATSIDPLRALRAE